jgi:hypothetical protein
MLYCVLLEHYKLKDIVNHEWRRYSYRREVQFRILSLQWKGDLEY